MKPFVHIEAIAAPLLRPNVDTDAIIPKQFLKSIEKTGYGNTLFFHWRYMEEDETKPNPNFVLNQEPYKKAEILLCGENFGCGSSREHAPWALRDFGFRCLVGVSFADIFYNNCFKNGILPAIVEEKDFLMLTKVQEAAPNTPLGVDLPKQEILLKSTNQKLPFRINPGEKEKLLEGLDDIGMTLKKESEILAFRKKAHKLRPWNYLQP